MNAAHVGGHGKGFPALSYPGLFRVTGPLLSIVFRTENVCQRCNHFIETAGLSIRVSPSHPYNAGRVADGLGGCPFGNVYAACSGCVVVLVLGDKFNDYSAPSTEVL